MENSSSNNGYNGYTLPKNLVFTRGFSKVKANEDILAETRTRIETNLTAATAGSASSIHVLNELAYFSFALPNLNRFDDEDYKFKEYLHNDLVEMPTLYSLTESGHLNWWQTGVWEDVTRPLYPMVTSGDGNCLLHAASLSMWGLHDRQLALRKALHSTLENIPESNESALWRRWRWEQACANRRYGLILSDEEWSREWRALLKLSSFQPRASNMPQSQADAVSRSSDSLSNKDGGTTTVYFESLEEFHVLLLAHILQRPIIIVSDTMLHDADGEPLSPIPFGGIYLPLECDVNACHRYPLVLAYDAGHFSALVLMDGDSDTAASAGDTAAAAAAAGLENSMRVDEINRKLQTKWPYAVIPITYSNGELLPVHFGYDPGRDYDWSRFPDTRPAPPPSSSSQQQEDQQSDAASSTQPNGGGAAVSQLEPIELSRDERMYLIQKYLDIVKIELVDAGPMTTAAISAVTMKRTSTNQATNSSGTPVKITNIQVPAPVFKYPVHVQQRHNNPDVSSTRSMGKSSFKQKFFNMFKREKNNSSNLDFTTESKLRKSTTLNSKSSGILKSLGSSSTASSSSASTSSRLTVGIGGNSKSTTSSIPQAISYSKIGDPASNVPAPIFTTAKPIFHKLVTFKSWSSLFDSMSSIGAGGGGNGNGNGGGNVCMLAVKLNLAKPPKYAQMIANYLESAKLKQQQQQYQQQNAQKSTNNLSQIVATNSNGPTIANTTNTSNQQAIKGTSSSSSSSPSHHSNSMHNQHHHHHQQQQQQQHRHSQQLQLPQPHHCVFNRVDCYATDLCSQCRNSESSLRSINLNSSSTTNGQAVAANGNGGGGDRSNRNSQHFSYNNTTHNTSSSSRSSSNKGRVVPSTTNTATTTNQITANNNKNASSSNEYYSNTDNNTDKNIITTYY